LHLHESKYFSKPIISIFGTIAPLCLFPLCEPPFDPI
jgi:hypothetical protein